MTAITAITAQTRRGHGGVSVARSRIVEQVRAGAEDIGVTRSDRMPAAPNGRGVARALDPWGTRRCARSGHGAEWASSSRRRCDAALLGRLLPRVTVVTPNLPRPARWPVPGRRGRRAAGFGRFTRRAGGVVLTGGHRDSARICSSMVAGSSRFRERPPMARPRSGCTHSSALAAHLRLARPARAARSAKRIAANAVRRRLRAGRGPGR